ncbi:hypothetical protein INT47_010287 [Mucor saturninus]|uniref:Uncharacterized protein n=1 Tax=Mucor saturninus TaxID=64648 RepID=A0A8H7QV15_9FUNG|nr:hypothetical protein INT47_010287 [Mucor saturninus]
MNAAIRQIGHFPNPATVSTVTFSQMRPRYIEKCMETNPRQIVQVDILGDLVQLPVYTLRRRNAMVHI